MNAVKSLLLVAIASFSLISCGGKQEQTPAPAPEETQAVEKVTAHIEVEPSSFKELDCWVGTFKGSLPSASGEGIDVTLKLNKDLTFVKTDVYKGKKGGTFTEKGSFTWNEKGDIITLNIKDEMPKYRVKSESLTMLDKDGNLPTGELADMYILKKAEEPKKAKKN